MKAYPRRKQTGFTIVELMVVLVIFSILLTAIGYVLMSSLKIGSASQSRVRTQEDVRTTLEYMSRLIRRAGIRPVDQGIVSIAATTIVFQADTNADGVTEQFQLSFSTATNQIVLTTWTKAGSNYVQSGTPQLVMDNVRSLSFQYYTANNIVTTVPTQVTAVGITLSIMPSQEAGKSGTELVGDLTGSTLVYCPNLAMRL